MACRADWSDVLAPKPLYFCSGSLVVALLAFRYHSEVASTAQPPYDQPAAHRRVRLHSLSPIVETIGEICMPEMHDAIRVQFETLHQSYIAELPRKILRAREIWEHLLNDGWDAESWQALHRLIHSLAGSGAIYGF